jgi:N-acetylmuramoyl-L-alanine amidase
MTGGGPARVGDLLQLKEIWESLGLHVEALSGWRDRGRGSDNTFEVLGLHHTGAARDNDQLLVKGRPAEGIPGPLCNVALHRNGDVILVASGRANHFGHATWPNERSLGVEATGGQDGPGRKFHNYDAYVLLAVGFCILMGKADPRTVVRGDTGIPVRLVVAHKEVALVKDTQKVYGRKPDPAFEDPGQILTGALPHGFSVRGAGVRVIDTFRDRVRARMTEEDISIVDPATREFLDNRFEAINHRIDLALQRIGGRQNSVYRDTNPDFKGLVMAKEALAEAAAARAAAAAVAEEVERIRMQLRSSRGGRDAGGPDA